MAVWESKLKEGTLTLGGNDFSCQPTNVTINTSYSDSGGGEGVEVLCGDVLPGGEAGTSVTRNLNINAIQDFTNPDGLMRFLRGNELKQVDFTWQATDAAEVASGKVECRLGDWGGDVARRLSTSLSLPISKLNWAEPPQPATNAQGGTPGKFLPDGSRPPRNKTDLDKIKPNPATAWTTGQWIEVGRTGAVNNYYWDGTAWKAGKKP